jgi:hypothetical protein
MTNNKMTNGYLTKGEPQPETVQIVLSVGPINLSSVICNLS